jgi:hypothetical protein
MYARVVDEAAEKLHALREEDLGELGLAAIVLAMSMAATEFRPVFALPLMLGGLHLGAKEMEAAAC